MLAGTTIREAYMQASSFFQAHSIESAPYCAELLLRHLFGWTRADFFLQWHEPFPQQFEERWRGLLVRRVDGEPVQYIIGEQTFFGFDFQVNRHVLIPRPETELLVEQVLLRSGMLQSNDGCRLSVVDVGTGSGAIPISLAMHKPSWRLTAVDLSLDALDVARRNARQHHVMDRIQFVHGDGLQSMTNCSGCVAEHIDVLISNPPYITTVEMNDLQREVRDYEPHLALCGGEDGLDVYRKLVEQMSKLPDLPKLVAFETGEGQTKRVAELLRPYYRSDKIEIVHDLAGKDRMVFAVY